MTIRVALLLTFLAALSPGVAAAPSLEPQNRPERLVLSNGVTVLLQPITSATQIALAAIYDVGSIHEPSGLPQASTLLRHLLAIPGTNHNEIVTSDTFAAFTHYDSVGDTNSLERLLQVEAQRLISPQITTNSIREEVSKCHAEAEAAEKLPKTGMLKEGFAALNQSWHWRVNHARLRSGLNDASPTQITRLHQELYQPSNLVLVIMGGFRNDQAAILCQKCFENLQPDRVANAPIDWTKTASENVCLWDSKAKALCLAFPPPPQRTDQVLLTLWGTVLLPKLGSDPDLKLAADFVSCPNQAWPVGSLPFFIYAMPKTNISLLNLQRVVQEKINGFASRKPDDSEMAKLHQLAAELNRGPTLTWATVEFQARVLGRQLQQDTSRTTGQVLVNLAFQAGLRDSLLRDASGAIPLAQKITADEMHGFLRAYLTAETRIATILLPEELAK